MGQEGDGLRGLGESCWWKNRQCGTILVSCLRLRCGVTTVTTEESSSLAQAPVLCDFCGRNSAESGPMIEGRALIPMAMGRPISHICAHCVDMCDSLFAQHERKNSRLEKLPT